MFTPARAHTHTHTGLPSRLPRAWENAKEGLGLCTVRSLISHCVANTELFYPQIALPTHSCSLPTHSCSILALPCVGSERGVCDCIIAASSIGSRVNSTHYFSLSIGKLLQAVFAALPFSLRKFLPALPFCLRNLGPLHAVLPGPALLLRQSIAFL